MRGSRRLRGFLCLLPTALMLAGCGSSTVFQDEFESDTVGQRPILSPPGNPADDLIYLSDASNPVPGQFTVVDHDDLGKSLRYANNAEPVYLRYIGFMSMPVSGGSDQLWASWSAVPNLPDDASPLDIWVGDGHFGKSVGIRLDNGRVYVQTAGGSSPAYEEIGTYVNGNVHSFVINLNGEDGTCGVLFSQMGAPGATPPRRPLLANNALTASRPTLYMWFSAEGTSGGTYTVDEVMLRRE